MRPATASDDGILKQEHGSSVRHQGTEQSPLDASTPQLEEPTSLLGSSGAVTMVFKKLLSKRKCNAVQLLLHVSVCLCVHLLRQDDSKSSSQRRSPLPKHSMLSIDLNANENSGTESGSESLEDGAMPTHSGLFFFFFFF